MDCLNDQGLAHLWGGDSWWCFQYFIWISIFRNMGDAWIKGAWARQFQMRIEGYYFYEEYHPFLKFCIAQWCDGNTKKGLIWVLSVNDALQASLVPTWVPIIQVYIPYVFPSCERSFWNINAMEPYFPFKFSGQIELPLVCSPNNNFFIKTHAFSVRWTAF